MERSDIDLYLARIVRAKDEKDTGLGCTEDIKKNALEKLKKIRKEISDVENLKLERREFFELFSICLPSSLLQYEIKEEQFIVFRSESEHLVLVVKTVHNEKLIDLETIKKNYKNKMMESKQQTQFNLSGCKIVNGIEVYFFTAAHSMPNQSQINYIFLFTLCNRTVILDFNIGENSYSYWKIIINTLIGSLRQEGIYGK